MNVKIGSCNCSSIQYSVTLDEGYSGFNCHWVDCRKSTGQAFASLVPIKLENLEIKSGELVKITHQGGSGNDLHRHCCKACNAPVYLELRKSGNCYLYLGLLDDISDIQITRNINFENGHFPFVSIREQTVEV